ncbi:MAG: hypothetical protein HY690_02465 [Chloroflexi bacterium]|nr:hypothetical protein [Chloroflexota bacterium]
METVWFLGLQEAQLLALGSIALAAIWATWRRRPVPARAVRRRKLARGRG